MAQRDQGMRMLINDEEDEEDDEDDDDDDEDEDEDEDEDDEDEDEEGEDEDENEDDDPLPARNLLSGGLVGDEGGLNMGLPGGCLTGKFSGFPMVLVPAYSLLKQEQLQLAQLAFVMMMACQVFSAIAKNDELC